MAFPHRTHFRKESGMRRALFIVACVILLPAAAISDAGAGLLVSEIACETPGDDWVEIFLAGAPGETVDISPLYVTMYYGTNERLGCDPITLHAADRPETPYDDRFAVIHLVRPGTPDESDRTGDTDRNGRIDVYCNNYSGSLWNTDCIVAIDTDDDPGNGGIIDCAAYSNRDGSPNETILSFLQAAQGLGQWEASPEGAPQRSMVFIGAEGLQSHMSIARRSAIDTNTQADFALTSLQTPGRENVLFSPAAGGGRLFRALRKTYTVLPSHPLLGGGSIDVMVFEVCTLRYRLYSPIGMLVYESPLFEDVFPGIFSMPWNLRGAHRAASSGLYLGRIEATSRALKKSETERIYLILSRYR